MLAYVPKDFETGAIKIAQSHFDVEQVTLDIECQLIDFCDDDESLFSLSVSEVLAGILQFHLEVDGYPVTFIYSPGVQRWELDGGSEIKTPRDGHAIEAIAIGIYPLVHEYLVPVMRSPHASQFAQDFVKFSKLPFDI